MELIRFRYIEANNDNNVWIDEDFEFIEIQRPGVPANDNFDDDDIPF